MFFSLSKILDLLLSPLAWAMGLVAFGLLRKTGRWARFAPALGLGVLFVFSLEPVANALWRLLEPAPRTLPAGATYDAVVLLGGVIEPWVSEDSGTAAYGENAERLIVTAQLLREGRAPVAILSGGRTDPRDRVIEAHALRDQLVALGIDPSRLLVEDRSRNTRENAVETLGLAERRGLGKLLVVTSAFHVERARDCFRAAGRDVEMLPVDFRSFDPTKRVPHLLPRARHLADASSAIRELAGRLVYRLVGYGRG
ncbi:MAG: YdcF family protein [Polyangiales bacterium]